MVHKFPLERMQLPLCPTCIYLGGGGALSCCGITTPERSPGFYQRHAPSSLGSKVTSSRLHLFLCPEARVQRGRLLLRPRIKKTKNLSWSSTCFKVFEHWSIWGSPLQPIFFVEDKNGAPTSNRLSLWIPITRNLDIWNVECTGAITKYVLFFPTTFFKDISPSQKNWKRYDKKMYTDLRIKYPLFLSDMNKTWIFSTDHPKMLKEQN